MDYLLVEMTGLMTETRSLLLCLLRIGVWQVFTASLGKVLELVFSAFMRDSLSSQLFSQELELSVHLVELVLVLGFH